jgi:hypothetical protein
MMLEVRPGRIRSSVRKSMGLGRDILDRGIV